MGEYLMKLNRETLKRMIAEAINDRKEESWILTEATQWSQYGRIMDLFTGEVGSVDQVVIMSPMNPHAKKGFPAEQNQARKKAFIADLKTAGFGYRFIEGKYGDPEDSYIIPHMSADEAVFYCYKYAQESFVYSVKQDPAPTPEDKVVHQLCYVDFGETVQDPNYPVEQYGEMYIVPSNPSYTVGQQTTDMNDFSKMAGQQNFYSAVPSKGSKAGPKFSMDFDFAAGNKGNITSPMSNPRNPKYVRETYISIKEAEVPNTPEAKKLLKTINERCLKVNDSGRMGSSRWRHRQMMMGEKKELAEIIKKHND